MAARLKMFIVVLLIKETVSNLNNGKVTVEDDRLPAQENVMYYLKSHFY